MLLVVLPSMLDISTLILNSANTSTCVQEQGSKPHHVLQRQSVSPQAHLWLFRQRLKALLQATGANLSAVKGAVSFSKEVER